MYKKTLRVALICLLVAPLNSPAASSAELDSLLAKSQEEAKTLAQLKIRENQQLISEITDLEEQIQGLQRDVAINRNDVKRNLIIAGGSAIATILALRHFGRSTGSEVADHFRLIFGFLSGYAGIGVTAISAGAGGVNYILVRVDERKLPILKAKLSDLKAKLQNQNENLSQQ